MEVRELRYWERIAGVGDWCGGIPAIDHHPILMRE